MTARISNNGAKAACDAQVDRIDVGTTNAAGKLRMYSGTAPGFVDDALSGNTLLAELDMSNPAFGAAADANPGGRATASAITADSSADATGTATFFRIVNRDAVAEIQGAITATGGGGEIELNTVSIVAGAQVSITSLTYTQPET